MAIQDHICGSSGRRHGIKNTTLTLFLNA